MNSQYWVLKVDQLPSAEEEVFTLFLFENGASGVQENLQFTQLDRKYTPHVIPADIKSLIIYFENPMSEYFIQDLKSRFPMVSISIEEQQSKDWLKEWKEQWVPFHLVDNIWVVPEWHRDSFEEKETQAIYIEPGMAFGTGTHETTQIASQLIVDLLKTQYLNSAVDVGTGSGILAVLMKLKGMLEIYAYDNDPESKRVFKENQEKNHAEELVWCNAWSEDLIGKVELTVANIIDGVLIDLKPQFQQLKSRYYIFTGVLMEREEDFIKEMCEGWDLQQVQRIQKGEWVGFCFEGPQ